MDIFSEDTSTNDLATAIRLLNESRQGFLKLFNNSPVCMSMTTTTLGKRTYVRVNKKFLEKFGYDESEIIGHTSIEVGILDQEESLRVGAIIKEKGRLQNDYVKCRTKNGEIVHTVSSIEMMDMNNETYLVSFFVDITKIIEQQATIEKNVQQLEAVNKELEAFSYSVSHDLRAPLRAIDGYAKILEEDFYNIFDDNGKKILTAVQHNAKKMSKLIDDLLAFARFGKEELEKTTIDMNALFHESAAELKRTLAHVADINIGELHSTEGDFALLKQVVLNLISNAIKYSSKKEKPVVDIYSKIENKQIYYTIRDNGDGFDMQYADRLFGVFQRLHSNAEFEGTGVGLAIVKRIIERHNGTIRAVAEPGKGAAFTFSLPTK